MEKKIIIKKSYYKEINKESKVSSGFKMSCTENFQKRNIYEKYYLPRKIFNTTSDKYSFNIQLIKTCIIMIKVCTLACIQSVK